MTQETCMSLEQLMEKAFRLSLDIIYSEIAPDGTYMSVRDSLNCDKDTEDMIWAWSDGLYHKRYERMASGRCSLSDTINFDVGKFEESVERDIVKMEAVLKTLPQHVKLSFAEMRSRGYRGKWAGE